MKSLVVPCPSRSALSPWKMLPNSDATCSSSFLLASYSSFAVYNNFSTCICKSVNAAHVDQAVLDSLRRVLLHRAVQLCRHLPIKGDVHIHREDRQVHARLLYFPRVLLDWRRWRWLLRCDLRSRGGRSSKRKQGLEETLRLFLFLDYRSAWRRLLRPRRVNPAHDFGLDAHGCEYVSNEGSAKSYNLQVERNCFALMIFAGPRVVM